MKTIKIILIALLSAFLLISCQQHPNINELLSASKTRKNIMDSIAGDSLMAKQMMVILMNGKYANAKEDCAGKVSCTLEEGENCNNEMKALEATLPENKGK